MKLYRRIFRSFAVIIALLGAALLIVSIPAGAANLSIKKISTTSLRYYEPQINNRGQVVWSGMDDGSFYWNNNLPPQVYLFDGKSTVQITNNDSSLIGHYLKTTLNDLGHIVWYDYTLKIIYFYDGNTTEIIASNDSIDNIYINNLDQIVWTGADSHIYRYDKGVVQKISSNTYPNRYPRINDMGQIVWMAQNNNSLYNFDIYLWSNGIISNLSNSSLNKYNSFPIINNAGYVAWNVNDGTYSYPGGSLGIRLWRNGQTIKVTDYGQAIDINNNGQILWSIFYSGNWVSQSWDYYLYENGNNIQIVSKDKIATTANDIVGNVQWLDDLGRIVLRYIGPNDSGYDDRIYYYDSSHSLQIINDIRPFSDTPVINKIGQFVWEGVNDSAGVAGIYLATPQTINVPTPSATPPLSTFPQPDKLFVDSGTFIKNNAPSFSPPSQQFLNDHQSALDRFISKFITSKDGFKASANLWKNVFNILGNTLSVAAISADAKTSTIKGINSLLLYVDKNLLYNIINMDNDSQLRAYIDILTYAKVPTNGYSFIFSTGSIFSEAYTFMFSLIADDPPDPNFTEVYQCPVAITSPFSLPELSQDMNKLLGLQLGSSYNTYYYLLGLTTSINRYSSALAAGDAISAGLQFEAFIKYLTLYDASAIQSSDYINKLKQGLITQGMPDVYYDRQDILNLQNQITLNGLPSEVITAFKTLGLTDAQISELKEGALNYVPPDSVSGSLYSNLSNGVNLLHDASSWRPPNPALYLLLLD